MTEQPQSLGVYKAINDVQKALNTTGISKSRKNIQQGYSFRGIDDIYNELCGLLATNGLCILPRVLGREVVERTTAKGTLLIYVTCEVELDFVSSRDGSMHTVKVYGEAMDSGDKATNKAMSAAYKYACLQAFCIPTEADNDADATTHEAIQPAAKPVRKNGKPPAKGDAERSALAGNNWDGAQGIIAKATNFISQAKLPSDFPPIRSAIQRHCDEGRLTAEQAAKLEELILLQEQHNAEAEANQDIAAAAGAPA